MCGTARTRSKELRNLRMACCHDSELFIGTEVAAFKPLGCNLSLWLGEPPFALPQKFANRQNSGPAMEFDINERTSDARARDAIFRSSGLTKVYQMGEVEVQALRGIDLDLFPGEFVVILGASGSGKSTLLNILGGLDLPSSGTVHYRDHNLTLADEAELTRYRREHVGFVFQFYNLIAGLTARENVALVSDIATNPLEPDEALRLVGLAERSHHYPAQLSGGEQQRVAIARAIVKRPDVLLCDEPTGALDVKTGVVVLEALARINAELGTLTAVITHNATIANMADRVVYLSDGRISRIECNETKQPACKLVW